MPTHPQNHQIDELGGCIVDDWTRDIPLCPFSRVATNTNQVYHNNGYKRDGHPLYETGFNFRQDDLFVYGLFSGKGSARCAKFAASAFPAELIFGQVKPGQSRDQILRTIREAWLFLDKQYLSTLSDLTVELVRMEIESENLLSQGAPPSSLPDADRVNQINREVNSVASGEICVLVDNTLFLSYAGECVAVLVHGKSDDRASADDVSWDISVLTCAHNRDNDDEKLRLGEQVLIPLDIAEVHQTRFLGHPSLKNIQALRVEPEELVIEVGPSWKFLILASPGVFEVVGHLNPSATEMRELAAILCSQIRKEISRCLHRLARYPGNSENSTFTNSTVLNGVAENVIEELARMHFRAFSDRNITNNCRPDMTLILRVFDESLLQPNEPKEPSCQQTQFVPVFPSTISSTISSLNDTSSSLVVRMKEPIAAYVDFEKFIERMLQDPTVPDDWLKTQPYDNMNNTSPELPMNDTTNLDVRVSVAATEENRLPVESTQSSPETELPISMKP
ncbi:TGF-beta-activated kinase 1 and MAP3K7-binding protein 1-like [Tropilaelaps mercedesae]|uniref:TGF-beta-activated kinase 1 and MAP3K7-binding protein 1-like n=1 Tax=Tropilaelaps mercedesae TaxID=418985 RepID=A0A1V9Y3E3_9ACAR|nr:TGF-beta-activated kinase 1 and MAP3K7-binding protein 1-like [Tropilaelaps mercedesae]